MNVTLAQWSEEELVTWLEELGGPQADLPQHTLIRDLAHFRALVRQMHGQFATFRPDDMELSKEEFVEEPCKTEPSPRVAWSEQSRRNAGATDKRHMRHNAEGVCVLWSRRLHKAAMPVTRFLAY